MERPGSHILLFNFSSIFSLLCHTVSPFSSPSSFSFSLFLNFVVVVVVAEDDRVEVSGVLHFGAEGSGVNTLDEIIFSASSTAHGLIPALRTRSGVNVVDVDGPNLEW